MAYATSDDLVKRYDARTLRELASDSAAPVEDLSTDAAVTAALSSASGKINAAVMVSGLYTAAQLAALTGDDLALLVDLTCDLAMARLVGRRPCPDTAEWAAAIVERAEEFLQQLRNGARLFNVDVAKDAGLPLADGPTAVEYRDLNLIPDRTQNFYPSRASRLPIGR